MNKPFCEQIDRESLVEEYVRGKLQGAILTQFEQHLRECERHAREVQLEQSLRNGVIEFARSQVRSTIRKDQPPQEDMRYAILRYAAFLFVAVVVPLILYYQFRIFQPDQKLSREAPGQKTTVDTTLERTASAEEKSSIPVTESATRGRVAGRAEKTKAVPAVPDLPAQAEEETRLDAALADVKPQISRDEKLSGQIVLPAVQSEAEQSTLDTEKQADTKVSQVAAGTQDASQDILMQAQRSAIKSDKLKTEYPGSESGGISAKKEQYAPIPGGISQPDSGRDENVRLGYGVSASGGKSSIDHQNINSQIVAQQADLLNCTAGPDSAGFILVKFQITVRGVVVDVQIMDTNITNVSIKECIIEKIRKWKFTAPGQETIITKKIYLKH